MTMGTLNQGHMSQMTGRPEAQPPKPAQRSQTWHLMMAIRKVASHVTLYGVLLISLSLVLRAFELREAVHAVPVIGAAIAGLESRPGSALLVLATALWALFVVADDYAAPRHQLPRDQPRLSANE